MEMPVNKAIDSPRDMEAITSTEVTCRHHWLLGQPEEGEIKAKCRLCGANRSYPASLDEYESTTDQENRYSVTSVATAAGGVRPSSGALLDE